MKKILLTVALAGTIVFANAQGLTSKNGTPILPEAGDWSIGFDAAPVLDYFGNLFNNSVSNGVNMNYQQYQTIVGKMVKDESTAYRARVGINFNSNSITPSTAAFGHDDSLFSPSKQSISSSNVTLGLGIQKWRGKGRLKGYYGAEAMIGFGGGTSTTNTFLSVLSATDPSAGDSVQVNKVKTGSSFSFGVDGFVGVEYFFAPKMSLSAEYNWGIGFSSFGAGETDITYLNPATAAIATRADKTGSSSAFNVGVGNVGGQIIFSFYF